MTVKTHITKDVYSEMSFARYACLTVRRLFSKAAREELEGAKAKLEEVTKKLVDAGLVAQLSLKAKDQLAKAPGLVVEEDATTEEYHAVCDNTPEVEGAGIETVAWDPDALDEAIARETAEFYVRENLDKKRGIEGWDFTRKND